MPFKVLRFFFRCPEDVFEDLGNMFSYLHLYLLWNVRSERKMISKAFDLHFEKGLVRDYLNRDAEYLDKRIENQNIGFEQSITKLAMGGYIEKEVLRKYSSLCDAAYRLSSRNSESKRYEKDGIIEDMSFILEALSKFKKVLKQHTKKVAK